MNHIPVEKNEEDELPIPHIWRPIFESIISAFVKQDYSLSCGVKNVNTVSKNTAEQIEEYIADYGEELIELPEECWDTSVYICYGDYWNVLIDLWTKDEGLSDLVLKAKVSQIKNEYVVQISVVYVP